MPRTFRKHLRCSIGFHAWDYIYDVSDIPGYGSKMTWVGYYCIRCGVESRL